MLGRRCAARHEPRTVVVDGRTVVLQVKPAHRLTALYSPAPAPAPPTPKAATSAPPAPWPSSSYGGDSTGGITAGRSPTPTDATAYATTRPPATASSSSTTSSASAVASNGGGGDAVYPSGATATATSTPSWDMTSFSFPSALPFTAPNAQDASAAAAAHAPAPVSPAAQVPASDTAAKNGVPAASDNIESDGQSLVARIGGPAGVAGLALLGLAIFASVGAATFVAYRMKATKRNRRPSFIKTRQSLLVGGSPQHDAGGAGLHSAGTLPSPTVPPMRALGKHGSVASLMPGAYASPRSPFARGSTRFSNLHYDRAVAPLYIAAPSPAVTAARDSVSAAAPGAAPARLATSPLAAQGLHSPVTIRSPLSIHRPVTAATRQSAVAPAPTQSAGMQWASSTLARPARAAQTASTAIDPQSTARSRPDPVSTTSSTRFGDNVPQGLATPNGFLSAVDLSPIANEEANTTYAVGYFDARSPAADQYKSESVPHSLTHVDGSAFADSSRGIRPSVDRVNLDSNRNNSSNDINDNIDNRIGHDSIVHVDGYESDSIMSFGSTGRHMSYYYHTNTMEDAGLENVHRAGGSGTVARTSADDEHSDAANAVLVIDDTDDYRDNMQQTHMHQASQQPYEPAHDMAAAAATGAAAGAADESMLMPMGRAKQFSRSAVYSTIDLPPSNHTLGETGSGRRTSRMFVPNNSRSSNQQYRRQQQHQSQASGIHDRFSVSQQMHASHHSMAQDQYNSWGPSDGRVVVLESFVDDHDHDHDHEMDQTEDDEQYGQTFRTSTSFSHMPRHV
ncbi:hypothetical protein BC831DRAFT_553870 [Entophlyctis helioformis]|nr:hypothetical protein BC831DRAFT_553870 [Entophlyctis helioformis]